MAIIKPHRRSAGARLEEIKYADFFNNISALIHKNDLALLTNEESIKNAIRNLLLTNRGERFFNPDLGSDIQSLLFENITQVTSNNLKKFIEYTIQNYEPRAQLLEVIVSPVPDENAYSATIIFSVINSNTQAILEMIINRVR